MKLTPALTLKKMERWIAVLLWKKMYNAVSRS